MAVETRFKPKAEHSPIMICKINATPHETEVSRENVYKNLPPCLVCPFFYAVLDAKTGGYELETEERKPNQK